MGASLKFPTTFSIVGASESDVANMFRPRHRPLVPRRKSASALRQVVKSLAGYPAKAVFFVHRAGLLLGIGDVVDGKSSHEEFWRKILITGIGDGSGSSDFLFRRFVSIYR